MVRMLRYAMAVLMPTAFSVPACALADDVFAHVPGFRGKAAPETGVRGVRQPPDFPKMMPSRFPALPVPEPAARVPAGARRTGRDDPGAEAVDTPMRDVTDTRFPAFSPPDGQEERGAGSGRH